MAQCRQIEMPLVAQSPLRWMVVRLLSVFFLGFCELGGGARFRATVQVVADEDSQGSALILSVSSDWTGPTLADWQLCFTWLKAVVLRKPDDAVVSGSYVCLPRQREVLQPGGLRAFMIEIGAPSMRFVSDLPKAGIAKSLRSCAFTSKSLRRVGEACCRVGQVTAAACQLDLSERGKMLAFVSCTAGGIASFLWENDTYFQNRYPPKNCHGHVRNSNHCRPTSLCITRE